jgi:hypothetical protein
LKFEYGCGGLVELLTTLGILLFVQLHYLFS